MDKIEQCCGCIHTLYIYTFMQRKFRLGSRTCAHREMQRRTESVITQTAFSPRECAGQNTRNVAKKIS